MSTAAAEHDDVADRILDFMANTTERYPGARFAGVLAAYKDEHTHRVSSCPFTFIDVWKAMSEQPEASFLGALVFNVDGNLLAVPVADNPVIYEMMIEVAKGFLEDTKDTRVH